MYQITKNCVCCHNCATECPMQAIDYVGGKYEIDPDKCVECGLCAPDTLQKCVDLVRSCKTVLLFGMGASLCAAKDAYLKFLRGQGHMYGFVLGVEAVDAP